MDTTRPRFVLFVIVVSIGLGIWSLVEIPLVIFLVWKSSDVLSITWAISMAMAIPYFLMAFGFIKRKPWSWELGMTVGVLNTIRFSVITVDQFSSTGDIVQLVMILAVGYLFVNRLRRPEIVTYLSGRSSIDNVSKVFE